MDGLDMISLLEELDIKQICIETAEDSEEQMVEAMQDQLAHGLRSDGSEIEPPYTPFTIQEKEKKSGLAAVVSNVTLFDSGAHYAALYADVKNTIIEYGSKDPKTKPLQDKYGKIYGLNEESREGLIEDFIGPRFRGKVERATGLIFK